MIIVIGIPGSGKSTVLKEVKSLSPDLSILNYGEVMLEEAKIPRDEMRRLPEDQQRRLGLQAASAIAKRQPMIVDTHALIHTPFGYLPGLPKAVLDILKPRAIVLIEASPNSIRARRNQDVSRSRDEELEEELIQHLEMSRAFAAASSVISGAFLSILSNDGEPAIAAKRLLSIIQ